MSTITPQKDPLLLGGHAFQSRFILGSGKFSLPLIQAVMQYGESEIATIALRRACALACKMSFLHYIYSFAFSHFPFLFVNVEN